MESIVLMGLINLGYKVFGHTVKSSRGNVYTVKIDVYNDDLIINVRNSSNNLVSRNQKIMKDIIDLCVANGYAVPNHRNKRYREFYMVKQR